MQISVLTIRTSLWKWWNDSSNRECWETFETKWTRKAVREVWKAYITRASWIEFLRVPFWTVRIFQHHLGVRMYQNCLRIEVLPKCQSNGTCYLLPTGRLKSKCSVPVTLIRHLSRWKGGRSSLEITVRTYVEEHKTWSPSTSCKQTIPRSGLFPLIQIPLDLPSSQRHRNFLFCKLNCTLKIYPRLPYRLLHLTIVQRFRSVELTVAGLFVMGMLVGNFVIVCD